MSINGFSYINRRNFLKGSLAGAAILPNMNMNSMFQSIGQSKTKIALVKTNDRFKGVTQVMKLMDLSGINGKNINIKPNFNSADDTPGSTHYDTLKQIVAEVQERGSKGIVLGESSGPGDTQKIMEQKGAFDLASEMKFDVINYDTMPENDWIKIPKGNTNWEDGFHVPKHVINPEYMISTCCLKTHAYGGHFTMSMKLSVGLVPENIRRGMHRSPNMRKMIAEINTAYKPQLIILDAVNAFVDGGPSRGTLKTADVFVAGTDRVAVDAVGVAILKDLGSNETIMGTKVFEQEQIARAVELGLGISGPDEIEFVTPDNSSKEYADKIKQLLLT
ncbi:DUF362 domain-containing protein [candidate division KSB1 bacterium]